MPKAAAIVGLLAVVAAGCAAPPVPAGEPSPAGAPVTFFLLVNRSGRDVRLRALADGRPLFLEALPAQPEAAGGARVHPGSGPHPTRELKVPLSPETRVLEVQELDSGAAARADIRSLGPPRLGFRVVVDPDGIRVSRDYYPLR